MIKWTTKGRIEVRRGGVLISSHVVDREAWESIAKHSAANGAGKYIVSYPAVEVDVVPITVISTDTQAPTQPGSFSVSAPPTGGLLLSWVASTDGPAGSAGGSGLRGYRVWRALTGAGPFTQVALVEKDTLPLQYLDLTVGEGQTRHYFVDAIDNAQNVSSPTATVSAMASDTTAPSAPAIDANAIGVDVIEVSLTTPSTDSGSGVASYSLERKLTSGSTWTVVDPSILASEFPYLATGLSASTSYDFRCRAVDVAGNTSAYSATASDTTQSGGPLATEISFAAWRASGSGTATFVGGIALIPGQLAASNVGVPSVWDGPTEIPARITALEGRHSNDTLRGLRVVISLSLPSQTEKLLTLKLTVQRTGTPPADIVQTPAWLRSPTLLYCTDPAHMCAARITPLPLVPMSSPTVPASWRTWLTTDFDAQILLRNPSAYTDQRSYYHIDYALMCSHMTRGRPSDLILGLNLYAWEQMPTAGMAPLPYYTPATGQWSPEPNPNNFPSSNPPGIPAEASDGKVLADIAVYYLTGCEFARQRIGIEAQSWKGLRPANVTMADLQAAFNYFMPSNAAPRFRHRWQALPQLFAHIVRTPGYDGPVQGGPPRDWTTSEAWAQAFLDLTIDDAGAFTVGDYRRDVAGFTTYYNNGGQLVPPTFQFVLTTAWLTFLRYAGMNASNDSRIGPAIDAIAAFMAARLDPVTITATGSNHPGYTFPYLALQPGVAVDIDNPECLSAQMQCFTFAVANARNPNPAYVTIMDRLATKLHFAYARNQAMIPDDKTLGEQYVYGHHSLAFRAGVPWDGWSVP